MIIFDNCHYKAKFSLQFTHEEKQRYCLALYLLYLKKNVGLPSYEYWKPYLDLIPEKYTTIIQYDDTEFKLFEETSLYNTGKSDFLEYFPANSSQFES